MGSETDEELEEIIERKIQERKKEWKQEAKEEMREEMTEEIAENVVKDARSEDMSRREFLKKAGIGAAGIGALSLSPATANLKLTKNGIFSDSQTEFSQNVNLNSNNIQGVNQLSSNSVSTDDLDGDNTINLSKPIGFIDPNEGRDVKLVRYRASGSSAGKNSQAQTILFSISTSTATVGQFGTSSGFAVCSGRKEGSNEQFSDVLHFIRNTGPTIINTLERNGPDSRSYNMDADKLNMSIASGTYNCTLEVIKTGL